LTPAPPPLTVDDAIVELRGKPEGPMTVSGTVNKTGLLLALTVTSAAATWAQVRSRALQGARLPL
jgi:uncharacterized YccA/Bax inhibitor family protein